MPNPERLGDVTQYLTGVSFPCSKSQLVERCRQQNCPTDVLHVLRSLPDREYHSVADVVAGVGQVE